MSTLNMLADQPSFGRAALAGPDAVCTSPTSFTASNAYPNDFLGLSQDNLWGLGPMSPTPLPSWTVKPDQNFVNPTLERGLKNTHVRNGQPTPPPSYDDKKASPSGTLYPDPHGQLDATPPELVDASHPHRRSMGGQPSGHDTGLGGSKRRRVRDSRSSLAGLSLSESDDRHQERAKREKFLERNRLAASKCRQKKKEHTLQLESRYKEQADKKEKLMSEIARLRSEILSLKNEVLKHAQCGDEPIKLHLAQMVKKITYNDTAVDLADAADALSSSESAATPKAPAALSFGFDDPLQLDPQAASGTLEQHLRRDSETSLASESSLAFSADDNFEDLINV